MIQNSINQVVGAVAGSIYGVRRATYFKEKSQHLAKQEQQSDEMHAAKLEKTKAETKAIKKKGNLDQAKASKYRAQTRAINQQTKPRAIQMKPVNEPLESLQDLIDNSADQRQVFNERKESSKGGN